MSKYKHEIIRYLYKQNEYLSGQHIAEALDCSRVTVKKVMDQLRNDGYEIESISNKGYKLNQLPDNWQEDIVNIDIHNNKILNKAYGCLL